MAKFFKRADGRDTNVIVGQANKLQMIQIKAGDGIKWNDFTHWLVRGFSEM